MIVIVLLAMVIRWEYNLSSNLSHDEIISVITAQGNVSAYRAATGTLTDKWVLASQWKSFLDETGERTLPGIAQDLARGDIHPPLYFWLLRGWLQVFDPEDAKALNLPIALLTAAALFALVRRSYDPTTALFAVAIWLLSPQSIRVSVFARQYELLGLLTVLIALQSMRIADGRTCAKNLAIFAVLALLGMLTQYLAAFVILAGIYVIVRAEPKIALRLTVWLCISAVLFAALHPGFYNQLSTYTGDGDFPERLTRAASTLLGFYGWRPSWTSLPIAAVVVSGTAVVLVAGTYLFVKGRFTTCTFIAPVLLVTLVLYLLILIPGFGARHLTFAWPFIAAAHAIVMFRIWPKVSIAGLAILALLVAPAESYVAYLKNKAKSNPIPVLPALIHEAKHIVITNTAMGILPRYLRAASNDALVYASPALRTSLPDLPPQTLIIVNPQYFVPHVAVQAESLASDTGPCRIGG